MSTPSPVDPLSYVGINEYTQPYFYNADRAPTSDDLYPPGTRWQDSSSDPADIYTTLGNGVWTLGGNNSATTTEEGIVELATLTELQNGTAPGNQVPTSNDVATVIAGVVAGAVPPANESQAGIAEIATQAETNTGTDDTKIVSPLKLATYVSAGGGDASFTDLTATGAVSFTGVTGAVSMTSTSASDLGVTGAGIDLTLDSAAGRLVATGGEAAADAVRIQADNAAGGIDVDAGTGGIAVDSTGAISLDGAASSNFSVSGAGVDLDLASSAGRIIATAGEDAADAIYLHADAGTSEKIRLHSDQGTSADSVELESDVGGITLTSGLASNDAINLNASAGGVDIDGALQVNIASSQSAADSIVIESSAGGIDILASGAAAGEDIDIVATGSSVNVTSTEDAAQAIYIRANGGTSETVDIHSDQGTGVASVNVHSDVGGVTVASGLASADAINLNASAGGVDIDGALEVNIASSQAASSAITLSASNASGGITHTGKCIFTPDAITSDNAGVAASVSTFLTQITTDGDSNLDNVTLADGVDGQIKMFAVVAAGNAADSVKITPANMAGGTQITFSADPTGLGCTMAFDGTNWTVVANNGGVIA